ncbi:MULTISPECIES: NAD(P)-dependent oxidoreductase [Pseudonocardia]|uniref:3-hydroxyisobutyrate dehydrogenase n=2 Tax=Pseudonocardia TaxID=1847 RepID=A0A1Y2N078_PSEAH|nr:MULTISPECIES: NAD(P)-dependent oxidoreductase [Pseudonocardia]OSY40820.1 3-hydroxyisobutyrate dehydrogenase [Pseudonocardia autotrophica]TDN71872.1 3-hydroxyisobutyrate dehydrogenase [Pseudonocardia autotrophica]BBG02560.1 tartronate semialdehyde reductase [Pseudonocardia autotrophica]GEC24619.1 tartronate semialdehyde reductase [Pseudonocardia saturnea]
MRVAFVGLGNMGRGMATNLVRAGIPTTVTDVRADVVEELVQLGATGADGAAVAAAEADVVCVAVFDEAQVREVLLGNAGAQGVVDTARPGCVVAIHSTVSPGFVREMAEVAGSRGVRLVDVAMTGGGDAAAAAGDLTFMVGGAVDAVADVRPVLQAMARDVTHLGEVSAGVSAKIISNYLAAGTVALVREALAISRAAGLGEDVLRVVEDGRVGASWVSNNWGRIRQQEIEYTTGRAGMVAMWAKDLQLARSLAAETGVAAPLAGFIVDEIVPDLGEHGLTG